MPIPLIAIMAAMTAAKYASDRDKEARDAKVRAAEQRNSPWTNRQNFTPVNHADLAGTAAQGGATYLAMDQNLQNQEMGKRLNDAQIEALTSYASGSNKAPYYGSPWDRPKF